MGLMAEDEAQHQWRGESCSERLDGKRFCCWKKLKRRTSSEYFLTPPLLCRWMQPIRSASVHARPWWSLSNCTKESISALVFKVWLPMCVPTPRISPVAQNEAANFIVDRFGEKYSRHGSRVKNASGAQCPRSDSSSSVFNTLRALLKYLDKDQWNSTLIWNRLSLAGWRQLFLILECPFGSKWGSIYSEWESGKVWRLLAIYNDSDKNKMLPDMVEGDIVKQVNSKRSKYFPNHLLAILKQPWLRPWRERCWRPSTYAPTIETIQNAIMWSW